jgi:signal peptidase I
MVDPNPALPGQNAVAKIAHEAVHFLASLFIPIALGTVFVTSVARLHYVPSQSMLPGLPDGSLVVAERYDLGIAISATRRILMLRPVRRGDIYVFIHPLMDDEVYVKRILGLPGDTVAYDVVERFSINGERVPSVFLGNFIFAETGLDYPRFRETLDGTSYEVVTYDEVNRPKQIETLPGRRNADACTYSGPRLVCHIPPGHYFVAGDNRDRSIDSRAWGLVPEGLLIGRVVAKLSL